MSHPDQAIRVLFVDDEAEFLESTSRALRRRGLDVTTAANGIEALHIVKHARFDVALLDVNMPGIDGHRLFHALNAEVPEMEIIMLTGHGDIGHAFELGKHGLFTYLAKPIDMDQLAGTIRDAYAQSAGRKVEAPPSVNEELPAQPIRVLLVDDELEFLESLRKVLSRRGMEVVTASDGARALNVLSQRHVDVVVTDVKMPGIDGVKLLSLVKKQHPEVEILLLTGHADVGSAVSGLKEGAFDYLLKPQDPEELTRLIRDACLKKREAEEARRQEEVQKIIEKNPC